MKTRLPHLCLLTLFLILPLAACGEVPTAQPENPPTPTSVPPTLPPTTAALLLTPSPTPLPTLPRSPRPTQPPSPTPWVVQPTPYAPAESLSATLPSVVYAVQRPEQPAQLWNLRYESGLLREELLLDLSPESLQNKIGSESHLGYARVEKVVFSLDSRYVALGLESDEGIGATAVVRIADGTVLLPPPPEHDLNGFLAWIPGREEFVWQGAFGMNWGSQALDGSSYTRYTLAHDVLDAVVSPDGARVIFSATPSEDIWLGAIDVDGTNLTIYPVPAPLPGLRARNLELSPNGQSCAFTWNRQVSYRGEGQIWVMNADGSNQRPLGSAAAYDYDLAWSPDGSTIAFARWDNPDPNARSANRADWISSLWLVDVESGQERQLLGSAGQYAHWSPRWLPDGSGLLLLSTRGGAADLWIVRPDGTGLQPLTRQGGLAGEIAVPAP